MNILAKRRRTSTIAAADDAALFAAVAALSAEAVEETYERHSAALCSLALLVAENRGVAKDAVAEAFIALWRAPTSICLEEQSLRAALAGEVFTRCAQARKIRQRAPGHGAKTHRDPRLPARVDLARLPRTQRDLLALIMHGDHNCRQAAHRMGLNEVTAARMITDALHTMRHVEGKPRLPVTAATGGADAPTS
jgi:DNA-directed RNA polymerase specialized sigma24 family protein